jgi:uncharacterized protein (DUF58 family)
MVRDLDRETLQTHWLLVDLGASMRRGRAGSTGLDQAIDLAAGYARAALEAGDRVGLVTYDGRIVAEVKPNDGPVHRLRLYEPLLEATAPVDEDLTEVTDSELIAQVGAYLLHQEGVKTRLDAAPRIDDPAWSWLASSPAGELYDLRLLFKAVETALAGKAIQAERIQAANPDLQRLRLYCRMRGIELPSRRASEAGRRARGLARALERAATGRGAQRILVLSDLEGLDGDLTEVGKALRLARRRGHQVTCAAPSARLSRPDELDDDRLAEIAGWEAERRERAAIRRVAALGLRVVPIAPVDPLTSELKAA